MITWNPQGIFFLAMVVLIPILGKACEQTDAYAFDIEPAGTPWHKPLALLLFKNHIMQDWIEVNSKLGCYLGARLYTGRFEGRSAQCLLVTSTKEKAPEEGAE